MLRTIAYWVALIWSAFATLFFLVVYVGTFIGGRFQGYPPAMLPQSKTLFLVVLVLPPLLTCLAVLWAWRRDRDSVKALERRTRELERTNHELGLKLLSAQTPMRSTQPRKDQHL